MSSESIEVCMQCMRDNDECATVWTRGCFHAVCDDCFTGACPLSMCVGGDYARMEHEERVCRRILDEEAPAPAPPPSPSLYEWLARLTNVIAVDATAAYCVHGDAVTRVALMAEPAPAACEQVLLVGADAADQSILVDTRGDTERARHKVWPREGRISRVGTSAETHECIPWRNNPATPWYVYDLDSWTVVPVLRLLRPEQPAPDPEHVRVNREQLRASAETRLKQIEWIRDARMQMDLTRERVARLPAEHPFHAQFARWQATPVELQVCPHELSAYERRMVEGDGIYVGDGRHTTSELRAQSPMALPPLRLCNYRVTLRGRTLMQLPGPGPYALAWDPHTCAALVTTHGRALVKFYCVYQMAL